MFIFNVFTTTFDIGQAQKWLTPFWNSHGKLDKLLFNKTIFALNKKANRFQLCLKTAASLFPFSCMTPFINSKTAHSKVKDNCRYKTTLPLE
jgi:hypothetical protein